jgi:hypothetical protein
MKPENSNQPAASVKDNKAKHKNQIAT